jgi:hypothetical protein
MVPKFDLKIPERRGFMVTNRFWFADEHFERLGRFF